MTDPVSQRVRRMVIVGGGTAGWIAAATTAHLYPALGVELAESDDIGTIPPFLGSIRKLGINESDFIRDGQASYKLGIGFGDWHRVGGRYFYPFGAIGMPLEQADLYPLWLRARGQGHAGPLQSSAPASVMAGQGRSTPPFAAPRSPVAGTSYALHVDAKRAAGYAATGHLAERVRPGDSSFAAGERGAEARLTLARPATAIVASGDQMALGALAVANRLGRRVPDDVSIVSFDDTLVVRFSLPPLTAIAQPTAPMAAAHVRPFTIVVRHSTGRSHVR